MSCCGGNQSSMIDSIHIPTWTEKETLVYLAQLARGASVAIECGTYLGKSAKVMLMANPKLTLYCIDTFACKGEPMMIDYLKSIGETNLNKTTFEICWEHTLAKEIKEERCILILGDSKNGANLLNKIRGENFSDLVFIDDGHESWQVKQDIECLLPLMKRGGIMVGHDYDGDNDVAQGVHQSGIAFDVPVPRLWRHFKR